MLIYTCPHCNKTLRIPEKYIGVKGRYNFCQGSIMPKLSGAWLDNGPRLDDPGSDRAEPSHGNTRHVGTYEESLPCGGKLKVYKTSWEISYYFPGPDLRYNGTFVQVPGRRVEEYIDAFNENWLEYERLKSSVPKGGAFSKVGKLGMTIGVGGFPQGVCISSYHMPISSVEQLERVTASYRYAEERAPKIQAFLASL